MMNNSKDRLYELLPAVYRQRDAAFGYPLRALLQIISDQVNIVETDIDQLYENWFIETCQDWVVPYIADLIGYRPIHEAGGLGDISIPEDQRRNKILISRREVANTIRYRRRKGTLPLLEQLASDVAGWPAHAVECYRHIGVFQNINHLHLRRGGTVDLRKLGPLEHLDGPFDRIPSSVDLRRLNIPDIEMFIWRLKAYSVTRTPARNVEGMEGLCYTFSMLRNDAPLYTHPDPASSYELGVPGPITLRAFEGNPMGYYGEGKSLQIWIGMLKPPAGPDITWQPVPLENIEPADLSSWTNIPPWPKVAVDPELGRIAFSSDQMPGKAAEPEGVLVSYYYGFAADIGGGEYDRPLSHPVSSKIYRVGEGEDHSTINGAYEKWLKEENKPHHAVIEITDSGVYAEPIRVNLGDREILQLRAANGARPIIRLLDWQTSRSDSISIIGETGSTNNSFTMDGLLITGNGVQIGGDLSKVTIRHCTLVPGWEIYPDCKSACVEPSLKVLSTKACINIEHSILGPIQVNHSKTHIDPIDLCISDSILDATSNDCEVIGAYGCPLANALLTIKRCTVFGEVDVHAIRLAENSIFNGLVTVARRQKGCMRFCYVPPGSRTPPRYSCQPDGAALNLAGNDKILAEEQVRPRFNSIMFGTPTYCQLSDSCAQEIKRGADDESEMGVFHDLYQPQRAANLYTRLDEHTPAGMDVRIIYIN